MKMQANGAKIEKKENEMLKLLFALIANSKERDRELAKKLHLSQTTITKRRKELEEEGFIQQYSVIPNLHKMKYDIIAFVFHPGITVPRPPFSLERLRKTREWFQAQPQVVFAAFGEGLSVCLFVSVHNNYQDFVNYLNRMRSYISDIPNTGDFKYFIIDSKNTSKVIKSYNFNDLAKL